MRDAHLSDFELADGHGVRRGNRQNHGTSGTGGLIRRTVQFGSVSSSLIITGNCYPKGREDLRKLRWVSLAEVHVNSGESLESALKRFKRQVMSEDIIKDIKSHSFYLKPGQKMRVKAALARKRARKNRSRDSGSDHDRK
jgi:small subunit ribosomal protein S21